MLSHFVQFPLVFQFVFPTEQAALLKSPNQANDRPATVSWRHSVSTGRLQVPPWQRNTGQCAACHCTGITATHLLAALKIPKTLSCLALSAQSSPRPLFFFSLSLVPHAPHVDSSVSANVVLGFWLSVRGQPGASAEGNNQQCDDGEGERRPSDGGPRRVVVALPGRALAAGSLAQDAREARRAVAALVVVAGAAVLTAQHRVVAHPGCGEQRRQGGGGGGAERGGFG